MNPPPSAARRERWPALWPGLLAAVGLALLLDGLCLLLFKGLASLGVLLPLFGGAALLAFAFQRRRVLGWVRARRWRRALWRLLLLGLALWLISLAVFFVGLARMAGSAQGVRGPVRAIIVLGSGTPRGVASPALQARLELARQLAQRFPQAVVAVSGGVDFGQTASEGQVMGDYLRAHGMPAARIAQEEASTSTELNLKLSQPVLAARGVTTGDPVVVVTSDFHVWRASAIARRQGWQQAQTIGAPTPLYLRYNAWLREYFATASSLLLGEM